MHVWRWHINMAHDVPPSLRGSVGDLKLRPAILHKKVQEYPSTPLHKPQEEVEDSGREVGPTGKIIIKFKTEK
jgi:hypothetical protein